MTSSTSIDLNLARREMVILGTQYAGEMKKGLFSLMHYLMPKRQILSLHSGCNMGKDGDVALFFGLSGEVNLTYVNPQYEEFYTINVFYRLQHVNMVYFVTKVFSLWTCLF